MSRASRHVQAHNRLTTGAELARIFNVSRQAIHRARVAGRLTVAGTDGRGRPLFDPELARREFQPDLVQLLRPVAGGRPSKKAIPAENEVDDRAAVVDDIEQAANEARQWLATASPAEITARRATTMTRIGELASRHRAYRSRAGCWPTGWPSWREFGKLEIELLELDGVQTDMVPD